MQNETKRLLIVAAILTFCGWVALVGCKGTDIRPMAGTLDGPLQTYSAPTRALEATGRAALFHQYEIMSDTAANVAVFSLDEVGNTPTECYGISAIIQPFVGTFLDEDNHEPNLHINYRRNDGRYAVNIGIFRLTTLDDGIGTMGDDGIEFTATDAAGHPIGGVISLNGDTAMVTFTNSHWDLLPNGSEFRYVRDKH